MSEPAKKTGHISESYTPKEVPEIMKLAQQVQDAGENNGGTQAASSGGSGMLPGIRGICNGMKGHNYALPDCLAFLWERLNESPALDFWQFAALTGDTVAQVYNRGPSTRCEYCVSGYLAGPEHIAYVFDALGYGHEYVTAEQIKTKKEAYLRKVTQCIDKGLPVLVRFNMADVPGWDSDVGTWSLIVGYAGAGSTLSLNFGCLNEGGEARLLEYDASGEIGMDWIFAGEKLREITLEEIYFRAIKTMAHWLTLPGRGGMFFGAAAFRAWADDIESGRYEDESVGLWDNYGVYVCNLATSGGEPTYLFRQLAELNPKHAHYIELGEKIQALLPAETSTGGKTLDWIRLDKLNGGLDVQRKVLLDKKKRGKIAAVLRKRAERLDEVVRILSPESYKPKEAPEIVKLAENTQKSIQKKKERFADRLSEITLAELPGAMVASYEVISDSPEQESGAFIEAWLEKRGLRMASAAGPGADGVVRYGFDCHKGRDICGENSACKKEQKGCWQCRIYHQYVTLPEGAAIAGDDDVKIKEFPGGKFARVAVRDPFTCDFPSAWYVLLEWTFKRKIRNRLGCASKKDCYSLFSNEETPCLEELYWDQGVQYMAFYLPVE